MSRQIYVVMGDGPKDWSCYKILGPFPSEMKARQAIREDVSDFLENTNELETGRHDDWCETYHLMEVVKSFKPTVTVKADVSLAKKSTTPATE